MKPLKSCFLLLAGCWALPALACDNPPMVAVPEGGGISMDQLLAAQTKVKSYMAAMQQYLDCLDNELDAQGDDAPEQFKSLMVTRHNAAVAEMESIATAFNKQVQAYKAANSSDNDGDKEKK